MLLRGTESADVLTGAGEDDTIYGFGGADTLRGGAGDDVLAGNEGNDKLYGGEGDDYILGGPGDDLIDGGAGNDWAAFEDATAGVTVDLTKTGAQNTGGGGRDTLVGIENVYGSDFNDTLIGDAQANMMVGGKGNDTLSGGKGDDTLWGSEGNDTLEGGEGDDYLVGGAGDDVIKGGAGWDWSSYEDAAAGVTVDLTKTGQQNTIGAGKDTLSGIEHLYGSKFNDVLTGDAGDNYLWGDAGDDKLYGGKGDDHLSGGAGVNIIDGGEGWDTVDYAFAQTGVEIDLTKNFAKSRGDASIQDTLVSIEAVMASAFDDIITGNAAENYIYGGDGNDIITAVGGYDTLEGGDGDDVLIGSASGTGDLLIGGAGNDFLSISTGATIVDGGDGIDTLQTRVDVGVKVDLRIAGEQEIASGVRVDMRNVENLVGGHGNDHLIGSDGDNVIEGLTGDDIMDGGAGFDIASYRNAGQTVRVDLSKVGIAQDTRGAGVDTLSNFEGLKGSVFGDILIGDAKDNTFEGGAGDDIIDGGAGNDTAIYSGQSKDYSWTHNANGTWTVRSLYEGADTLLNIETLKFADKSVTLSPSATTVTVDDLTKTKVLVSAGVKDAIFSADGQTAYVATSDGHVKAIDIVSGAVRTDIKVGTELGGMDVSADGRYLVVTEGKLVERSSPGGAPSPMATVHVVDLKTGVVTDYNTFVNGQDRGFVDAAFLSDSRIILTQANEGLGSTPLTTLDIATGGFTRGTTGYGQGGFLSASNDHRTVLIAPTGASPSSLSIFTAAQGEVSRLTSGGNVGMEVISGDGSRIAQGGAIFDGSLNYLFGVQSPYLWKIHGIEFSADSKHLYVVDALQDLIYDFSATTGALQEVYAIGADINPVTLPDAVPVWGYGDRVSMSRDGQNILIMDGDKVVSVNMAAAKLAGGTEGADVIVGKDTGTGLLLRGFGGDDRISGTVEGDTIVGGKGADTLTGGFGSDTFVFAPGDTTWSLTSDAGVDVVTDWEAGDKLSFGLSGPSIALGKQTVSSWTAAATIAPQAIATQHLTHLAFQVGADVYVFYAKPGMTNGTVENVVKLTNTTLDKVSVANLLSNNGWVLHGDESDNILVGGGLDDVIHGHDGDDVIDGGQGRDILYGGVGADTFKFTGGSGFDRHDPGLTSADVIMDFGAGDKLAFVGGSPNPPGITNYGQVGSVSGAALLLDAIWIQSHLGNPIPEYVVMGVGEDTWVVHAFRQAVQLKNFSSSLMTPDMFTAA